MATTGVKRVDMPSIMVIGEGLVENGDGDNTLFLETRLIPRLETEPTPRHRGPRSSRDFAKCVSRQSRAKTAVLRTTSLVL